MRLVKRSVACLLALCLIVPAALFFLPARDVQAAGGVYAKLMSLQSKFPAGKYWNHIVPASEAGQDCRNEYYADFVTSTPCKAHRSATAARAGDYDCNFFDGGIQCCGFAKKVFFDVFGERESSNSLVRRNDTANLSVGDYVAINGEAHYCVVTEVNGSSFKCVECNLDQLGASYNCQIRWGYSYNKSQITYFVHSNRWREVDNQNIEPTVSWSVYEAQEIREGKIMLAKTATLSGAIMDNVSSVGIDIFNSSGSYLGGKSETPNRMGHTYVNMWYDLNSELGFSITPGTVYQYSFWVIINGKKYSSNKETVICPPVYTVKFDAQGGSSVSQLTVGKNQTISNIPVSSQSGFDFDGWYTSATGGTKLTNTTKITGNITYFAHWNKYSYSISLSSISNGSATLSKTSATEGEEISVSISPSTGYTLDSIKVNGTAISGNKFTMPAKNTTVEVTFKKVDYTISVGNSSNGRATVSKNSANYGDEIIVTAIPESGYSLDSIKVNGTEITGNKFTMPAKNAIVEVSFKKTVYTVSVADVSNGTVNVSKTEANFGDEITITATPNTGYEIEYIKVNGTTLIGASFLMPSKDVTVEVAFKSSLSIITQPSDFVGIAGSTAKFSVVAEGSGLQYQWQLKKGASWANLSTGGAKTPTMTVKVDDSKNGKVYRCLITTAGGEEIVTNLVSITVKQPSNSISISTQPVNFVGTVGSSAKFTVLAEGSGLKYQWQLKKGSSWANLSTGGATTPTMTIKVDESKNGKVYRCLITDTNGEELASESVSITVKDPSIKIISQPSNYVGLAGSTAKFTVSAEGNGLQYQWQLKKGSSWANLSTGGAKTSTMTIKVDDSKNGKEYRCLITSVEGEELVSETVSITVKQPSNAIVIDAQPTDYTGTVGTTAKFTVAAQGNGLSYQWQLKKGKSWSNLTSGGATTSTMSIKVDTSKDGKTYRCVITDSEGNEVATEEVVIHVVVPVAAAVPAVAANEASVDASNDTPEVNVPDVETAASDEIV